MTDSVTAGCSGSTLLNGGFSPLLYWSSSQWTNGTGDFAGYVQDFSAGTTAADQWGDGSIALRPIRAFAPPVIVPISVAAIAGVTPPVTGATPVSVVISGNGYTGTVTWSGAPSIFAGATVYTATITLTATSGYTLNGVSANFFTVESATSVSNSVNSGVITAVFPATHAAPSSQSGATSQDNQSKIKTAQALLVSKIKDEIEISLADLIAAGISMKSGTSLDTINKELQVLQSKQPKTPLTLDEIQKVVKKVSVIESLANPTTKLKVSTGELVAAGYLDAKNPNKVAILLSLRKLAPSSLDSIEKIESAITKQIDAIKARKDRLQRVRATR